MEKGTYKYKPHIILIVGDAKSGKSTQSYLLLQKKLRAYILLDGDSWRKHMDNAQRGFTKEEIIESNRGVMKKVEEEVNSGWNMIVAMICPYVQQRQEFKQKFGDQILIVELKASTRCRENRLNFRRSAIQVEDGASDISFDTEKYSPDYIRDMILDEMRIRGWIE